jgi:hypothetical protein
MYKNYRFFFHENGAKIKKLSNFADFITLYHGDKIRKLFTSKKLIARAINFFL